MKNVLLVLNAIFAVAIVILFALVLRGKNQQSEESNIFAQNDSLSSITLPIAYINLDSLLLNYQFAKDENEKLMKKGEDSRLKLNTKAKDLQAQMNEFQRKLENNAFLSRERAEKEQTRLIQEQQKLQNLENELTQELMIQQQKVSEQLRDSVNNFLGEYNKNKHYEIIFSNAASDNILYADKKYDITKDVIEKLNKRLSKK